MSSEGKSLTLITLPGAITVSQWQIFSNCLTLPCQCKFLKYSKTSTDKDLRFTFNWFELLCKKCFARTGISSTLSSINFFASIQNMRCYGITLVEISLFGISLGITASILLIVLPVLTGALVMLLTDLHYNTVFFDPLFGGDPVFYQHLFWFFGHPEVYILILPAFGVINILQSGLYLNLFNNQCLIKNMQYI